MATNINYEYVDETSIDPELICSVCGTPFNDPLCTPCDHTFCRQCITTWINNGNVECPICRDRLSINGLTLANRTVRNMLNRLAVRCGFCEKTGLQRDNFGEHTSKECLMVHVSCPSADISCPWKGPRDQLNSHATTCVFQPFRSILSELMTKNQQLEEQLKQQDAQIKRQDAKMNQQDAEIKQQDAKMNQQDAQTKQQDTQIKQLSSE